MSNPQKLLTLTISLFFWVGLWAFLYFFTDLEESLLVTALAERMSFPTPCPLLPHAWNRSYKFLDIPSDLPSGLYELRLFVYNADTSIPTVEIGTWKAERLIAKMIL